MRRLLLPLVAAALAVLATTSPSRADSLPTDPSSAGYITLCDPSGHAITSGSTTAAPFVWRAVSSFRPPANYQGNAQSAILAAYQVRPATNADQWSGDTLTAAGFYSDPALPAAQATVKDFSFADLMSEYPPMSGGLYELRMQFGKTGYGLYGARYPTTFIRVHGTTWTQVDPQRPLDCNAARTTSFEVVSGDAPSTPPSAATTGRQAAGSGPSAGASDSTATSGTGAAGGEGAGTTASGTASEHHGGSATLPLVVIGVGLAVVGGIAATLRRAGRRQV